MILTKMKNVILVDAKCKFRMLDIYKGNNLLADESFTKFSLIMPQAQEEQSLPAKSDPCLHLNMFVADVCIKMSKQLLNIYLSVCKVSDH